MTTSLHNRAYSDSERTTIRTALAAGISGLALVVLIIAWWFGRKFLSARRRRKAAGARKEIDLVEELSEDLAVMEERFCGGKEGATRDRSGSGRSRADGTHMSWAEKLKAAGAGESPVSR